MTRETPVLGEEDGARLLRLALEKSRAGDHRAAAQLLEEARSSCPESSTILYHLGRTHTRLGSTEKAMDCYLAAVTHDPGMVKAHVNLALLYMRRSKLSLAEEHLLEACKHDPDSAAVHLTLGALYAERGKTGDGIHHLEKAAVLSPNDPEAHFNLGLAYQAHGLHNRSVRSLQKAVQLKPDDADLLYHLASSLQHAGKLDDAMAVCRRVIDKDANLNKVYRLLGHLYDQKGMKPEANQMHEQYWASKTGARRVTPPSPDDSPRV